MASPGLFVCEIGWKPFVEKTMAVGILQDEQAFLIGMAVSQFNSQYNRDIDPEACSIHSIEPDYGTDLGYEVKTNLTSDYVRLRMYLGLERRDAIQAFRLETDKSMIVKNLGDEVYVAMGSLSSMYIDNGIYRFRWIDEPISNEVQVTAMDSSAVTFMDGEQLTFMETV